MEPTGREPAVRDGSGESLDLTGSAEDGAELGELLGVEEGLALGDEEGELVGEEEGSDVGAYGKRARRSGISWRQLPPGGRAPKRGKRWESCLALKRD